MSKMVIYKLTLSLLGGEGANNTIVCLNNKNICENTMTAEFK